MTWNGHTYCRIFREIILKFAVDYLENVSTLNGWWHLVAGVTAWTWAANQRPVSGPGDQWEAGSVGSAQFICVMILKQNLSVRALLSACHPGPGSHSLQIRNGWGEDQQSIVICIIQWSKSEFWQFVGFDSWLLTSLLCTQSFQPAPCDKSIPAREMPILRSCVWLFWEFYKSITSI